MYLWCWVDGKLQLGFLAVIDGKTFHKEGSETGSGTSAEGVEDKETLETGTLISKFSDSVKDKIDDFFTDGVVTASVVVGCILFAGDQLFGVEKLSVSSGTDLICRNKNAMLSINTVESYIAVFQIAGMRSGIS